MSQERIELRQAIKDCRDRGLFAASKWAAIQLAGLPQPSKPDQSSVFIPNNNEPFDETFELARSFLMPRLLILHFHHLQEYKTTSHLLRDATDLKSIFLKLYALYLAGERRRDAVREKRSSQQNTPSDLNTDYLDTIETEVTALHQQGKADGFVYYLLGLVLLDKEKKEDATQALTAAVRHYPCNWSAWKALQACCSNTDIANTLDLPNHFTRAFFMVSLSLELQESVEALSQLQSLSERFPGSEDVVVMAALAHNNLRNYDEAQELFMGLLQSNPHRIEGMDVFSNILYVKEETVALSHLAHRCVFQDKYRPETCCIIGNYYSLRGQHERAVTYFRRALKLDPGYLPAWTLMGHEYVELKNPPAAIDAYRKAVAVNPHDYRAWYGLGQTYELVNMPHYALYYFRRAVALRPEDARMWNAMGHCYQSEALQAYDEAIRCHRRALPHDKEGVAMHQLARLHTALGQRAEAAHYHKMNLDRIDAEGLEGQDAVDALTFLAEYTKDMNKLEEAEAYYTRLLDFGISDTRENAKMSLVAIRNQQAANRSAAAAMNSPGSDMGITPPRG